MATPFPKKGVAIRDKGCSPEKERIFTFKEKCNIP